MKNKKEYLNKKNNYFHGIMFHHFHNTKKHKSGQGSISGKKFIQIINFIGKKNILNADEFLEKFKKKKLKKNHVCLTFDDGALSQYDIALPILNRYKIKAFFFFYSSMFTNKPDLLEIYRFFRLNFFKSVNHFYQEFYNSLNVDYKKFLKKNINKIKKNKIIYPHYSIEDIKFRFIRDKLISKKNYKEIMNKLFKKKKFIPKDNFNKLFMNNKHIQNIHSQGHLIGLHSHSHPTVMKSESFKNQLNEYSLNIKIFSKILKCSNRYFKSMSHPCGSFNGDTKKVLKKLNINLGFIAKMSPKIKSYNQNFEVPRQDHTNIVKMLKG